MDTAEIEIVEKKVEVIKQDDSIFLEYNEWQKAFHYRTLNEEPRKYDGWDFVSKMTLLDAEKFTTLMDETYFGNRENGYIPSLMEIKAELKKYYLSSGQFRKALEV